jgi:KUP system potassium uptake protein
VRRDPNITGTVVMERHLTGDLKPSAKNLRYFIEHNAIARNALKVVGVLGVTMVMAGLCYISLIPN